jgi:hypothetical protein
MPRQSRPLTPNPLSWIGCDRLRRPLFQHAPQQPMNCCSRNGHPVGTGGTAVAFTTPLDRATQIIGHLCWRGHFDGDFPLRQVAKKVSGVTTVIVDRHRVILLLCKRLSELCNQNPRITWHNNLLDRVETTTKGSIRSRVEGYNCAAMRQMPIKNRWLNFAVEWPEDQIVAPVGGHPAWQSLGSFQLGADVGRGSCEEDFRRQGHPVHAR